MSFRHIIDLVDFFEGVSESVIVMEFAEGMISTSTIFALRSLKFKFGSNLCHRNWSLCHSFCRALWTHGGKVSGYHRTSNQYSSYFSCSQKLWSHYMKSSSMQEIQRRNPLIPFFSWLKLWSTCIKRESATSTSNQTMFSSTPMIL